MEKRDILVIGGGPAGAGAAIRSAHAGARVTVFEKGVFGRDKVCGDGLTPRAVAALQELKLSVDGAHRIDGLRMIAHKTQRELQWPTSARFPGYGAVWPRKTFDAYLMKSAEEAGVEMLYEHEAEPILAAGSFRGFSGSSGGSSGGGRGKSFRGGR